MWNISVWTKVVNWQTDPAFARFVPQAWLKMHLSHTHKQTHTHTHVHTHFPQLSLLGHWLLFIADIRSLTRTSQMTFCLIRTDFGPREVDGSWQWFRYWKRSQIDHKHAHTHSNLNLNRWPKNQLIIIWGHGFCPQLYKLSPINRTWVWNVT